MLCLFGWIKLMCEDLEWMCKDLRVKCKKVSVSRLRYISVWNCE